MISEEHQIARPSCPSLRDGTELIRKVRIPSWLIDMIQLLLLSVSVDRSWEAVGEPVKRDIGKDGVE